MFGMGIEKRLTDLENDDLAPDEDEDVADTTLQLVFFDGEEAFVSWTDKDSIYGARYAGFNHFVSIMLHLTQLAETLQMSGPRHISRPTCLRLLPLSTLPLLFQNSKEITTTRVHHCRLVD